MFCKILKNISGNKDGSETSAAEYRARLESIMENMVDGILTIDEKGIVQNYNKACEKIFGYAPAEVIGHNIKMLMPSKYADNHDQYLKNYRDGGAAKIIGIGREVEGKRKDGTIFPVDLSVAEVRIGSERLFSGIVRDITNLKRAEASSHAYQARLESILENMVDGLITIDMSGTVQSYNRACERIFGYAAAEVIGRNIKMLMPSTYADNHDQYLKNYRDGGAAKIIGIGREVEGRRKDGTIFPIDLSVAEVRTGGERLFSGIVRDISVRKESEKLLRRSNEELEQFAYIASHDLKAPLRGIDNLAKWIAEDLSDVLTDDARSKMTMLRGRVSRLEMLLEDILQYSRAGRIADNPADVDTADMVRQIAASIGLPAGFRVDVSPGMPVLKTSYTPLQQVFLNLISNARKHHDRNDGLIEIRVQDSGNFYEFSVADDGPGIPPEFHERIFKMFQTLKPRDDKESSGLGLSIVKKLVEWQGGRVWIVSEAGKRGTAFHFLWPKKFATNERKKDAT